MARFGKRIEQIMKGTLRNILKAEKPENLFGDEEITEKQIQLLAQAVLILDKDVYYLEKRVAELEEKLKKGK